LAFLSITGGISFSLETLQAIALGGLFALPLVGLRLWSWSPAASNVLPSLEDMHIAMLREAKPFYSGMSWSQVLMMNALQIPPFLLLLLPASQGIIAASTAMSSNLMHPGMMEGLSSASEAATQAHDLLVRTTGLILTSGVVAIGQSLDLSLGIEEIEVLEVASENADRFYRVMSPDATSSNTEADTAANAFRAVVKAGRGGMGQACSLPTLSVTSLAIGVHKSFASSIIILSFSLHTHMNTPGIPPKPKRNMPDCRCNCFL